MFATALLQSTPAPQSAPSVQVRSDDITVASEKLSKLQLSLDMDGSRLRSCVVKVSSRDAFIDGMACASARTCVDRGVVENGPLLDCIDNGVKAAVGRRDGLKDDTDARN